MNFQDFIIPPDSLKCEKWQMGNLITNDIPENGIVLLWISDYRGAGGNAETLDFNTVRKKFYRLSKLDFDLPICDLGDLVSGKTVQDTNYVLQEVLSTCFYKGSIPIIIGGSVDFSFSLFSALNFHKKNINYTHISDRVSLQNVGNEVNESNFLSKIFSTKNFSIKNFHLLGYQKHLNETDSVKIIKEVDFDILRLADMMGNTDKAEPFFRNANIVTLNCDAVESFSEAFSIHPQVNGLNRREICAYMKEIGLSDSLDVVGVFNYNFDSRSFLNDQLLAQMLWYLLEGINITKSHPRDRKAENFLVLIDDQEYTFKRDVFTGLWYFGDDENLSNCIPCSSEDFENAKKGHINPRLLKF